LTIDDRPTSKQKVSHPGQKSHHFYPALNTVAATPVPTPLEREAASRGIPPPPPSNDELFADPYTKSADLPTKLADEFKRSNVNVSIPGQKRRELTQPTNRGSKHVEMRQLGGVQVQLSWGMLNGAMEKDIYARIGEEVKIFKSSLDRLATFKVSDAVLVQV
jgi:hypothetical protein